MHASVTHHATHEHLRACHSPHMTNLHTTRPIISIHNQSAPATHYRLSANFAHTYTTNLALTRSLTHLRLKALQDRSLRVHASRFDVRLTHLGVGRGITQHIVYRWEGDVGCVQGGWTGIRVGCQ